MDSANPTFREAANASILTLKTIAGSLFNQLRSAGQIQEQFKKSSMAESGSEERTEETVRGTDKLMDKGLLVDKLIISNFKEMNEFAEGVVESISGLQSAIEEFLKKMGLGGLPGVGNTSGNRSTGNNPKNLVNASYGTNPGDLELDDETMEISRDRSQPVQPDSGSKQEFEPMPEAGPIKQDKDPYGLTERTPAGNDQFGFALQAEKEKFQGVDPRLAKLAEMVGEEFPLRSKIVSTGAGRRSGEHGKGNAFDIILYDQSGEPLPNYGAGSTPYFRAYEMFYQKMFEMAKTEYPELADGIFNNGELEWGGMFGNAPRGQGTEDPIIDPETGQVLMDMKYGSADTMDFRIQRQDVTRAGNPLEGINEEYKGIYDLGAEKVGLPGSTPYDPKIWAEHAKILETWSIPEQELENRDFAHTGQAVYDQYGNIGPNLRYQNNLQQANILPPLDPILNPIFEQTPGLGIPDIELPQETETTQIAQTDSPQTNIEPPASSPVSPESKLNTAEMSDKWADRIRYPQGPQI